MNTNKLYQEYTKTLLVNKRKRAPTFYILAAISGIILAKPDEASLHVAVYYLAVTLLVREIVKALVGVVSKIYNLLNEYRHVPEAINFGHQPELQSIEERPTAFQEWILKTLL